MRIQKIGQTGDNIQGTKTHNKSFTAGKVNLYSDFDGTYIPAKFNHDSVCNYAPPVNKGEFKSYFDKIWELFGKLRGQGEENKFNFVITTGRNLTETNYFLNKLKQQDLWVPLPEKLVTCNGQDEFYKNVKTEEEFYRTEKEAFVKENANEAKREYYKSKGWDYTGLMSKLKELLSKKYYEREIEFLIGSHPISQKVKDFLRLTNDIELEKLLNEINTVNTDENGIRKILESKSRVTFPDLSGIKNEEERAKLQKQINDYNWHMGELAHIVYMEKARRHEVLESIPTTRSNKEYGGGISLQSALERIGLHKDDDYVAFSDDGSLGVRIGVSKLYQDNVKALLNNSRAFKQQLPGEFEMTNLSKGSYAGKEFEIKPPFINKFEDTKNLIKDIIENNKNDLVIVAGDGDNDCKMLNIKKYVSNQPGTFIPENKKQAELFNNIPLVAIFVDNRTEKEKLESGTPISELLADAQYFNYDGRLRFIHVDAADPAKPHTLEEAIKMAVCDYAKYNEEFKKNLPPEIQKMVEEYKYSYPHDKAIDEKMSSYFNTELYEDNFAQEKITKISHNFERLFNYGRRYDVDNIEDEALDENSELDTHTRELVLSALSIITASYTSLFSGLDENKAKYHVQKYLKTRQAKISDVQTKLRKTGDKKRKAEIREELNKQNAVYKKLKLFLTGKKQYIMPENIDNFIKETENKKLQQKTPKTKQDKPVKSGRKKQEIPIFREEPHKPVNIILPEAPLKPGHIIHPGEYEPIDVTIILPEKPEPPEELWLPEKYTAENTPKDTPAQPSSPASTIEEQHGNSRPSNRRTKTIKNKNLPAIITDFMKSSKGMILLAAIFTAASAFCVIKCKAAFNQDKRNNIENVIANIK